MKSFPPIAFVFLLIFSCHKQAPVPLPAPPMEEPAPAAPAVQSPAEIKLRSPLATLTEAPLDVAAACSQLNCRLLLLYSNRVEFLDWQQEQYQTVIFPPELFSSIKSRAPSGKIVPLANGYLVVCNTLAKPVSLNEFSPAVYSDPPAWLPLAQPGYNWFTLQDGRFYDFQKTAEAMVAIDTSFHLNLAREGKLMTSQEKVGSRLCVSGQSIYTSSPSLSGESDAILKFDASSIQRISSRSVNGQILDLTSSDLNHDGSTELLVTVQTSDRVVIEILEAF